MTTEPPFCLENGSGLRMRVNANGSIHRIEFGGLLLNLFPGNEMEGGPANLFLRRRAAQIEATPLLGPRSPARIRRTTDALRLGGEWRDIRFAVTLRLARAAPAWFWHVELENRGRRPATVDLLHAQDLALADYGAVRVNEYYVSHYVDYTPLDHPTRGTALAARQNLPMGGKHPWLVLGSLRRAVAWATDASQFYGRSARAGGDPEAVSAPALPSKRRQGEHSMAALQDAPVQLGPGARAECGFFAWFESHHAPATDASDLSFVDAALALPEAAAPAAPEEGEEEGESPSPTLFSAAPRLACRDLRAAEIAELCAGSARELEEGEGGRVFSLFTGEQRHVVLRAKELAVLRPHGHLLRTGVRLAPDEASLTSTAWMAGVFHSLLTQGHVAINRFLSTVHGYLSLFRSDGLRAFVELSDGWHLLDVPSAWEVEPSACRWIYRHERGSIEVRVAAAREAHRLHLSIGVPDGPPRRFLLSHHVAVAGDDGIDPVPVRFTHSDRAVVVHLPPGSDLARRFPDGSFEITPLEGTRLQRVGGDELLFADGRSRAQPYLVLLTEPVSSAAFCVTGRLVEVEPDAHEESGGESSAESSRPAELTGVLSLELPEGSAAAANVARLREILPWFAHDASIHHLAPRGLEQYTGGGWGTRDVCQGPVEWLLSIGRFAAVRDVLRRVFAAQNPDGDWPQWFMFFERERRIRPPDSHGDIVFWPVLALARYLLASEDFGFLDEELPFFDERDEGGERAAVCAHVERALALMERRVVPGTALAAYGHGDWNDSLQPADPAMRDRLCSAWTVSLHRETLSTLARALRLAGREEIGAACSAHADRIRDEFWKWLVDDGVVAGYAYFAGDGRVERWMHPRDASTGVSLSLLPIIHAIASDLFTPAQAASHIALLDRQLLAPDGARLFDWPLPYRGGPQRHFQRAESSAYFGREIGLLYTHAHLRYAEAMARWGDGEALFLALRQANPIGIREVVPSARPRQACCYASSSDADFPDRYEAAARYGEIWTGEVAFEGGWRVYSSGPGIFVRLVREFLLGLRASRSRLVVDPVLPRALDGLRARVALPGGEISLEYRIAARGHGPTGLWLDGRALPFAPEPHPSPYRAGGVEVASSELRESLASGRSTLVVELG